MAAPSTWIAPTGVEIPSWTSGGLVDHVDIDTRRAYDVDMAVLPIAIDMEINGIPVNVETFKKIEAEQKPEWTALWHGLQSHVTSPIPKRVVQNAGDRQNTVFGPMPGLLNPKSPKQLQYALYDPDGPCKLSAPKRTATGQPSADADALAKLADHPFVEKLLKWRSIDYAFSHYIYGSGLIIRADGRLHPSWNTTGARSGRWSSSPNVQNWELWLREAIEAPPGWVIWGADYSQLEGRIMAALSGDETLIGKLKAAREDRKLEPDYDWHSFVASHFFGEAFLELSLDDPDEVKQRKALRDVAKTVFYALSYGSGASTILEAIYKKGYSGMPLTKQLITQLVASIFELAPGLQRWREETIQWSMDHGQVRSPLLNRWRYFPWHEVPATIAGNFPVQSCGADLINLRLIELARRLPEVSADAEINMQVHDALYGLCREEDADKVSELVTHTMSVELKLHEDAPLMPFPATCKTGKTWNLVS